MTYTRLLVFAALALFLGACGGDDEDDGDEGRDPLPKNAEVCAPPGG